MSGLRAWLKATLGEFALTGVWIFNAFLKTVALRVVFFWTGVVGAMGGMTQLLLVTGALPAMLSSLE
jgi:BT1 family